MKILQVNAVYKEKSTGRTCYEVEKALAERGHECCTAYAIGNWPESSNAYRVVSKAEYYYHDLMARVTGKEGYFSKAATKRFIDFIEQYQPDVIHLRNLHGHYLYMPLFFDYLSKKGIPVIQNLHDCWVFTGGCPYYTTNHCDKWQTSCGNCPEWRGYDSSWFVDSTAECFRDKKRWFTQLQGHLTAVGVSKWIADEAKQSFFKDCADIRYIYNWINRDVFHPYPEHDADTREKYDIPQNIFMILGVSAGWTKGSVRYEDFLKLSGELKDDEILVVAGGSGADFPETANIKQLGYISDVHELARLNSCADVYVHLSTEDTFGKVIAEAMSCGTPCIVYDVTACPEVVGEDGGIVVAPRDVDGIYSAVEKIKENGKSIYSQKCIDRVRENFDYRTNVGKLIDLYQQLTSG